MIKPITKRERLNYTTEVQTEKGIDELLGELYYNEGYNGLVDIWFTFQAKKNKLIVVVESKKIESADKPLTNKQAYRYQVIQGKGIKNIVTH
jgi:hypothetical protein